MANPFTNQVQKISRGVGAPLATASAATALFTASPTTATLTLNSIGLGGNAVTINRGLIHFRTKTVSAAVTTAVKITITDGTTTETIESIAASVAGEAIERTIHFTTDLNVTAVALIFTLAGTVGTGIAVDSEVWGN